ncbi:hypothetical protein CSKR_106867 [Clonorchis sinensis]|uniref:Uncharacterized protein n=1 Tax=Clonorchis sinensis TaxID=79923 RepID=A0A8T1MD42_CLOSI|nr:hypothetical protein CSKR_106867 [Clonorchis sinensis]
MNRSLLLFVFMAMFTDGSLADEKIPLTLEEMKSEEVRTLIVRAQNICNSGLDDAKWFGLYGDVTGTKELTPRTKYELRLALTETDCVKSTVTESGGSSGCQLLTSGSRVICQFVLDHDVETGAEIIGVDFTPG